MRNRPSFFFVLFPIVLLFGCTNPVYQNNVSSESQKAVELKIKYAEGFEIRKYQDNHWLVILDPNSKESLDSINIQGKTNSSYQVFPKISALSTTHFAFFNKLDRLKNLVGLCGTQYLTEKQKQLVSNLQEICGAEAIDPELILNLNTDLVFLYPFDDQSKTKLKRLGIKTLMITEYLEAHPLARAEWLKVFDLLIGIQNGDTRFAQIEASYLQVQENVKNESEQILETVAFNLPFGESWDMPSGNSISATLVQDAGFDYLLADKQESGNIVLHKEEAFELLGKADVWIIAAARPLDFSMEDLTKESRIYGTFPAVKNKRVFFCNTNSSPYFSEGPVEPEVLLRDLVNCRLGYDQKNKYFKILR